MVMVQTTFFVVLFLFWGGGVWGFFKLGYKFRKTILGPGGVGIF